jgi:hypothetical protein
MEVFYNKTGKDFNDLPVVPLKISLTWGKNGRKTTWEIKRDNW